MSLLDIIVVIFLFFCLGLEGFSLELMKKDNGIKEYLLMTEQNGNNLISIPKVGEVIKIIRGTIFGLLGV